MFKTTIVGVTLACAACCTVPLILPGLVGVSVFGFQLFHGPVGLDALVCAVAMAVLAFVAVYVAFKLFMKWRRRTRPAETACQADGRCGCGKGS